MKTITVEFEVNDEIAKEQFHELLCLALHEDCQDSIATLQDQIANITMVKP